MDCIVAVGCTVANSLSVVMVREGGPSTSFAAPAWEQTGKNEPRMQIRGWSAFADHDEI